jgi:hypothetical protein
MYIIHNLCKLINDKYVQFDKIIEKGLTFSENRAKLIVENIETVNIYP